MPTVTCFFFLWGVVFCWRSEENRIPSVIELASTGINLRKILPSMVEMTGFTRCALLSNWNPIGTFQVSAVCFRGCTLKETLIDQNPIWLQTTPLSYLCLFKSSYLFHRFASERSTHYLHSVVSSMLLLSTSTLLTILTKSTSATLQQSPQNNTNLEPKWSQSIILPSTIKVFLFKVVMGFTISFFKGSFF